MSRDAEWEQTLICSHGPAAAAFISICWSDREEEKKNEGGGGDRRRTTERSRTKDIKERSFLVLFLFSSSSSLLSFLSQLSTQVHHPLSLLPAPAAYSITPTRSHPHSHINTYTKCRLLWFSSCPWPRISPRSSPRRVPRERRVPSRAFFASCRGT